MERNLRPDVRYFCDSHKERHPCRGTFFGEFMITPQTTRGDLVSVLNCGAHLINTASGRWIHDLFCCACGEWVGDMEDPEIRHVSLPLETECRPRKSLDASNSRCRACEEMMEAVDAQRSAGHPGGVAGPSHET